MKKLVFLLVTSSLSFGSLAEAAQSKRITGYVVTMPGGDISPCFAQRYKLDGKWYVRAQHCPGHEGLDSIGVPADGSAPINMGHNCNAMKVRMVGGKIVLSC